MVLLHYMDKPLMNTLKAFIKILLSAGNYSSNRIQLNLEQLNFPNSALFQRFSVENAVIHGKVVNRPPQKLQLVNKVAVSTISFKFGTG